MQKESKVQLSKMMSLMERMDRHYTNDQAKILLENDLRSKNLLNEEIEEADRSTAVQIDNNTYSLSDPNELVRVMSKEDMTPAKGWFVTLGYVEGFSKLGNKKIANNVGSFNKEVSDKVKGLGFDRLNNIIDNPTIIDKGKTKGNISNPYMPDSYSNFIVRVDKIQLMYGRNEEYGKQKQNVQNDLAAYQEQNPEDIKHYSEYMASKGRPILDFPTQSYDDARATQKTRIPNTNIYQYDDGSYEMSFNTPLKAFKRLKTAYFLITDENTIEEISEEEAKAYGELFGVEVTKKVADTDEIVKRVDKFIKDTKQKYHSGDLWTQYKLNSIFLLNFATEDGRQKLQYYNPNAVVRFVKGRELKSGNIPSRYTASGVFKPHLEKMKQ